MAGGVIERLQAIQRTHEALVDADTAAFDWLDTPENRGGTVVAALEEITGGRSVDDGI